MDDGALNAEHVEYTMTEEGALESMRQDAEALRGTTNVRNVDALVEPTAKSSSAASRTRGGRTPLKRSCGHSPRPPRRTPNNPPHRGAQVVRNGRGSVGETALHLAVGTDDGSFYVFREVNDWREREATPRLTRINAYALGQPYGHTKNCHYTNTEQWWLKTMKRL